MESLKDFIEQWNTTEYEYEHNIRSISIDSGSVFANFFTIEASDYQDSYWIRLYVVKSKRLIETGHIFLGDIMGVQIINESIP